MPFVNEILKYKSLSIVGLEKNTGKTECLNYILARLPLNKKKVCVTSIGIDGERVDQVTSTSKPEIYLREGLFFATSEKHYKARKVLSELIDISDETTSLGRVVTAKAITPGKVLLSGPSSTSSLKRWMEGNGKFGIDLTMIDGALSRMSTASPAVSEAMILSTGAAYSSNMETLIHNSAFVVEMINLPLTERSGEEIPSISSFASNKELFDGCDGALKLSGALTDSLLRRILNDERAKGLELIIGDFTKLFITPGTYRAFQKMGGKISVERKSTLIAVCVNPFAPNGYSLDSNKLTDRLSKAIGLPVYDIVKTRYEA